MDGVLAWLTSLPPLALYAALGAAAALENIFPPLPADTVVAFGSFLAARGRASPVWTFVATWSGSVGGAVIIYAAARRLGAGWLSSRLDRFGGQRAEERVRALYARWGWLALFASRFLPGVRAVVPPFAGVLRAPVLPVILALTIASGMWYGVLTYVAFRVGSDWDALVRALHSVGIWLAVGALALAAAILAGWVVRRRGP